MELTLLNSGMPFSDTNFIDRKNHYSAIFNLANNSKNNELESQTLYKAYKSLESMGYIKKQERGKYIITDIFLKIFLQQNNIQPLLQEVDFIGLNIEYCGRFSY